MHNAAFAHAGLPYRYIALNVPAGQLGEALSHLRNLGYIGASVTMPHKVEALSWVSHYEDSSYPEVRAVNTVRFRDATGFNTDTVGLRRSLSTIRLAKGSKCLILGAGGAAAAAIAVLTRMNMEVSVWNRTRSRAESLVNQMEMNAGVVDDLGLADYRLVINCTSAGKSGDELPIDWSSARLGCVAYDLFYSPTPTPFLEGALTKGLTAIDGVEMLVFQGVEAWACWEIPQAAPIDQMEKTVREYLSVRRRIH